MAKALLEPPPKGHDLYLNWDDELDQQVLLKRQWRDLDQLIVMDEVHKFSRWKNWLKGVFDTKPKGQRILVTGSARLDIYRRGGDSMLGRYHYWRLHPFCLDELPAGMSCKEGLRRLLEVGPFPEPFMENDPEFTRRWRRERFDRILRDDLRDLENLRNLSALRQFVEALRRRVGSPIVFANLSRELQVTPKTLVHWLEVLERMYLVFVVWPYTTKIPRAVQKPPKVYFYDTMDVIGDIGARFENLVATHLLKRIQFYEDRSGYCFELRYLRDKEQREVDFVLTRDDDIQALVEAKWAATDVDRSLRYYHERLGPKYKSMQVVGSLLQGFDTKGISVQTPQEAFTQTLPLHGRPLEGDPSGGSVP
jgi:predicted AAA+ superfamily ATPase